jgi:hypothetical protein
MTLNAYVGNDRAFQTPGMPDLKTSTGNGMLFQSYFMVPKDSADFLITQLVTAVSAI